jgi:hypothetical protein
MLYDEREGWPAVICIETRHIRVVLEAQVNKTDRNNARGIALHGKPCAVTATPQHPRSIDLSSLLAPSTCRRQDEDARLGWRL